MGTCCIVCRRIFASSVGTCCIVCRRIFASSVGTCCIVCRRSFASSVVTRCIVCRRLFASSVGAPWHRLFMCFASSVSALSHRLRVYSCITWWYIPVSSDDSKLLSLLILLRLKNKFKSCDFYKCFMFRRMPHSCFVWGTIFVSSEALFCFVWCLIPVSSEALFWASSDALSQFVIDYLLLVIDYNDVEGEIFVLKCYAFG